MNRTNTNNIADPGGPAISGTLAEAALAQQLGINRQEIKKIRASLAQGEDWLQASPNAPILITKNGQKKIRAALDLPEQPAPASIATLALEWPALRLASLTVERLTANRMILFCTIGGAGGTRVRLRVKDNSNFTPGMEVQGCRHIQADFYEFSGRMPRRKGRWT